jgi:hypothetical protein
MMMEEAGIKPFPLLLGGPQISPEISPEISLRVVSSPAVPCPRFPA